MTSKESCRINHERHAQWAWHKLKNGDPKHQIKHTNCLSCGVEISLDVIDENGKIRNELLSPISSKIWKKK